MTDQALVLFAKSTVILLTGALVAYLLRRRSAAARHLVWLSTMLVLLLVPIGFLLPRTVAPPQWNIVAKSGFGSIRTRPAGATATRILLPIWAMGSVLLLIRIAISGVRAVGIIRRAHPVEVASVHSVRLTPELPGPVAWSFGRGHILLPEDAMSWPRDTLRSTLQHEAAHLARRDCEALLAAEIACALYWVNPLIWYARRRLRAEQEHAADDAVLQQNVAPADYAHHLVELARFGRTVQLLAGAAAPKTLPARVAIILDNRRRRTVQNRRMLLASAAVVVLAAIPLAALQADDKVYKMSDDVTPAKVLFKQEPKYTEEARDAKLEGTVKVTAIIERDGRLSNLEIVEGLDHGLNENALAALETWLLKPAEKDGTPVRVSCTIEVNFRLL